MCIMTLQTAPTISAMEHIGMGRDDILTGVYVRNLDPFVEWQATVVEKSMVSV